MQSWFDGALPLTGHPSFIGATAPGPWYLYATSLPGRVIGGLLGGNYFLGLVLATAVSCAWLFYAAARTLNEVSGRRWASHALLFTVVVLAFNRSDLSVSPMFPRPATVGFFAALCLTMGVVAYASRCPRLPLSSMAVSLVLLAHSHIMNLPFVALMLPVVLGAIVVSVRRRVRFARVSALLCSIGFLQVAVAALATPHLYAFWFRRGVWLLPEGVAKTELERSHLLGTLTSERPLVHNGVQRFPPEFRPAAFFERFGLGGLVVVAAALLAVVAGVLLFRRSRLAGLAIALSACFWFYALANEHLLAGNVYVATVPLGFALALAVFSMLSGGRVRLAALGVLLLASSLAVASGQGPDDKGPRWTFFSPMADKGLVLDGMVEALDDEFGPGQLYAVQTDHEGNDPRNRPDYWGAAMQTWAALSLADRDACLLVDDRFQRVEVLTVAHLVGARGVCDASELTAAVELRPVFRRLDPVEGERLLFETPAHLRTMQVFVYQASGGVTVWDSLARSRAPVE